MLGMLRRMGMRGTWSAMATELDYLRALKVGWLPKSQLTEKKKKEIKRVNAPKNSSTWRGRLPRFLRRQVPGSGLTVFSKLNSACSKRA